MGDAVRFAVGGVELTRVEYFDIGLGPDSIGLAPEQVAAEPWAAPTWANEDGEVLVGQAMWVLRSGGTTVLVDPCGASDAFLRTGPEAIGHQDAMLAALAAAGFTREDIDVVLLSHLDGIGLIGVVDPDGRWTPAFPDARIVVTQEHLDFLASDEGQGTSGDEAFGQVQAHGVVDGVADGHEVAPGITLEITGAHIPGHAVIRIGAGDDRAVMVGHLMVSPLHGASGPCQQLNNEPDAAWAVVGSLVADAAATGTVVIGPLWPRPGAGRVELVDGYPTIVPIAG
jgi:hypothetical protein